MLACDVTTPNELDVTLVFGEPNCTRLSALNASMRACSRMRLRQREVLEQRQIEIANAVGPQQRERRAGVAERERGRLAERRRVEPPLQPILARAPSSRGSWPFQFARVTGLKRPAVLLAEIVSGVPLCIVTMPLICQPPSDARRAAAGAFAPNRRPRPNGSSYKRAHARAGAGCRTTATDRLAAMS